MNVDLMSVNGQKLLDEHFRPGAQGHGRGPRELGEGEQDRDEVTAAVCVRHHAPRIY